MEHAIELATVGATVFAGIGLLLTAHQIGQSTKQQRAREVSSVLLELNRDGDLRDIYYQLEYGRFEYGEAFHGSPKEKQLDGLLGLFESLARQRSSGLLRLRDLDLVSYHYLVVFQNSEVGKYLNFLDEWFKSRGIGGQPFHGFRETGALLETHVERRSFRA